MFSVGELCSASLATDAAAFRGSIKTHSQKHLTHAERNGNRSSLVVKPKTQSHTFAYLPARNVPSGRPRGHTATYILQVFRAAPTYFPAYRRSSHSSPLISPVRPPSKHDRLDQVSLGFYTPDTTTSHKLALAVFQAVHPPLLLPSNYRRQEEEAHDLFSQCAALQSLQSCRGMSNIDGRDHSPGHVNLGLEDERDHGRLRSFQAYPAQQLSSSEPATSQPTSTNASFTSQGTSIASTVTSPENRPRVLHVSTILNPSPESGTRVPSQHAYRPYDVSRRQSLAHIGSPPSMNSSMTSSFGPNLSHPSSPAERFRSGSFPHHGNNPTRQHLARPRLPRGSIPGLISAHEQPLSPIPRPRRAASMAGIRPDTHAVSPMELPHPPLPGPSSNFPSGYPFPPVSSSVLSYSTAPAAGQPPLPPFSSAPDPGNSRRTTVHGFQENFVHGPPGRGSGNQVFQTQQGQISAGGGMAAHYPSHPMMMGNGMGFVDTTAGSKGAAEKRARNAKASARFRQRRADRGKELTIKVKDMEATIKNLEEERDSFRGRAQSMEEERDYWMRQAQLEAQARQTQARQAQVQQVPAEGSGQSQRLQHPQLHHAHNVPSLFARSETPVPAYAPVQSYASTPGNYPGPERLQSVTGLLSGRSSAYTSATEHQTPIPSVSAAQPQVTLPPVSSAQQQQSPPPHTSAT